MSADNWTACPKCQPDLDTTTCGPGEAKLREDWELGIIGNEFYVNYRASCRQCKYRFNYKHEERLTL